MDWGTFVHDNPMFSTVAVGSIGAYAATAGRRVPESAKTLFLRKFTTAIEIGNDDPFYELFEAWLSQQPYSKRSRFLSVSANDDMKGVAFNPAPGNHMFWFEGNLVWYSRRRDEKSPPSSPWEVGNKQTAKNKEWIIFRVINSNVNILRSLCLKIFHDMTQAKEDPRTKIAISDGHYWNEIAKKAPRGIETVILPDGQMEELIGDLAYFKSHEDWYVDTGIPYRRGYLLHGLPGTGKTSLVRAVASHFKSQLYIVSLSDNRLSDSDLLVLLAKVKFGSIVLFEDIDALFGDRSQEETEGEDRKRGVTFSGLLNALDGVATKDGLITFISTNHIEKLDPALIRPGRCDMRVEFKNADYGQLIRLFNRFNPGTGIPEAPMQFAHQYADKITMAEAQEKLLLQRITK